MLEYTNTLKLDTHASQLVRFSLMFHCIIITFIILYYIILYYIILYYIILYYIILYYIILYYIILYYIILYYIILYYIKILDPCLIQYLREDNWQRSIKYNASINTPKHCDTAVANKWFRFVSKAGTTMPTTCPKPYACGKYHFRYIFYRKYPKRMTLTYNAPCFKLV